MTFSEEGGRLFPHNLAFILLKLLANEIIYQTSKQSHMKSAPHPSIIQTWSPKLLFLINKDKILTKHKEHISKQSLRQWSCRISPTQTVQVRSVFPVWRLRLGPTAGRRASCWRWAAGWGRPSRTLRTRPLCRPGWGPNTPGSGWRGSGGQGRRPAGGWRASGSAPSASSESRRRSGGRSLCRPGGWERQDSGATPDDGHDKHV